MSVKSLCPGRGGGEVVRYGLLKKLKTARKKWFVLRAETADSSARLEYYDSEKKFNGGVPPKRSIPLKTCFNINKRLDTKYKHVIALYTKDDCFCIILDSEEELEAWLKTLLSLQHGEEPADGEMPKPTYEHVWIVIVLNRGLGTNRTGDYRLCLTDKTLTLIKKDLNSSIELNLSNIRSCGSLKHYFFLEIGRSSQLGAGELWMESEDANIAHNIHTTIFHAMSNSTKTDEMGPKSRTRSSSATESSKPNTAYNRKPQHSVPGLPKTHIFSQDSPIETQPVTTPSTVATTTQPSIGVTFSWSGTISHQRTQSLPLTPNAANAPPADSAPVVQAATRATCITGAPNVKRSNQPSKCTLGARERCDSMPSRPRTTSEGTHHIPTWRPYLMPYQRTHGRDISHSPPSGSPVSPPSVGCSTDSTGSSYSLTDETDVCTECPDQIRYSVALTPDEAIAEEEYPESPCGHYDNYVQMARQGSDDGYVDMSPRCRHTNTSPSASMSSVTSGTPSTDIRFTDYPLDKVASYLVSEEDDARPARAYSVGSRPETYHNRRHVELAGTPENARARAFSVGAKTKRGPVRVLPPHHPHHPGVKSRSAPILTNSRAHSSHGSIGPMDDLMEMDFSRSNTGSSTNSGYVEMKPGVDLASRSSNHNADVSPYVDMTGNQSINSGYVDMSDQDRRLSKASFAGASGSLHLDNYVDMDQRKPRTSSSGSVGAGRPSVSPSPGSYQWGEAAQSRRGERVSSFNSQMSTSPNFSMASTGDYAEMSARTPDGYVEMSVGGKKHQRQSSLDSERVVVNGEYTNMSLGSSTLNKKKANKKENVRSMPITINPPCRSSTVIKNSTSPISISSLLGRKSSTGTPPRMHLPISSWATSSLPRQKVKKEHSSQNNSKDSSSSSITTPSSSSTIFPMSLNSPSSPMKPNSSEGLTSTLKLPAALFNAIYKSNGKSSAGKAAATRSNVDDYTMMDFESARSRPSKSENRKSDYVNYGPGAPIARMEEELEGDYTLMSPEERIGEKKGAIDVDGVEDGKRGSPLENNLSNMEIDEPEPDCFRPEKENDGRFGSLSPRPGDVLPKAMTEDNKTTGTASTQGVESPYEILRSTSEPTSITSEERNKHLSPIGSEKPRPSSVNSEVSGRAEEPLDTFPTNVRLHYASLDLEEGERSPRSAKGSSVENGSQVHCEPAFFYAEIDFVKSEGLRSVNATTTATANTVKH